MSGDGLALHSKSSKRQKRCPMIHTSQDVGTTRRGPSKLELLPNELLQEILLLSLNLNLACASPALTKSLDNYSIKRRLVILAFGYSLPPAPHYQPDDELGIAAEERSDLQARILQCRWFTAELFFSCADEYFSRRIPDVLAQLTRNEKHRHTPWHAIVNHIQEGIDVWYSKEDRLVFRGSQRKKPSFQDLPWPFFNDKKSREIVQPDLQYDSNSTSLETHTHDNRTVFRSIGYIPYNDIPGHMSFWLEDENDKQRVSTTVYFRADFGTFRPWPTVRLFNPETWTDKHVALLVGFRSMDQGFNPRTPEDRKAISDGLFTAIEQKCLPAIFFMSKPFFVPKLSTRTVTKCSNWIKSLIQEMRECESSFQSKAWFNRWQNHLETNPQLRDYRRCCFIRTPNTDDLVLPTREDHLIRMFEVVVASGADLDVYFSFCWLCISFIVESRSKRRGYPESTLQKIYALMEKHGQDMGMAKDCWIFFNERITDLWPTGRPQPKKKKRRRW